jgi:hypothetical protein
MMFSGSRNNMYGLIEGLKINETAGESGEKKDKEKNVITKALESGPQTMVTPFTLKKKSNEKSNEKPEASNDDDKKEEGFQVRKPVDYAELVESRSETWNLSKWVKDALKYSKGMGNENRLDSYKYHTGPKIPLPEGQLFFFNNTKFDSDCCPSTYTNSKGCACLSQPQFNHLMMRGGNNTPPKNTNTAYFNEF